MEAASNEERKSEIAKLVAGAKAVLNRDGVSRSSLSKILKQVQMLASKAIFGPRHRRRVALNHKADAASDAGLHNL